MQKETKRFRKLGPHDYSRMWLPVYITNPDTGSTIRVLGLIDTGADECALPASLAARLGHNFAHGTKKEVNTGNGVAVAYSHTVAIKFSEFSTPNVLIDFMPHLNVVLLGVKSFLSNFILTVDYPHQVFTLEMKK